MAQVSSSSRRTEKSAAAFRTISEVADELDVQQHVLRFWETKFNQVRPLKRGGGRRYYRPEDVLLLKRIRELLYDDGYTIKGVQRLLRDGSLKPSTIATVKRPHVLKGQETRTAPEVEPPQPVEHPQNGGDTTVEAAPVAAREAPGPDEGLRDELKEILAELRALRAMLPDRST